MKRKVHKLWDTYMDSWPQPVNVSECGREWVYVETSWRNVTCKRCLAKRRKKKK
jgi:hypothetical protein